MSNLCVNTEDKFFLSLTKEYNVSTSTLEHIIHSWQNISGELEYSSEAFKSYLNDKLGRGNTIYTSKTKFDRAHAIWKAMSDKYSSFSSTEVRKVRDLMDKLFDENAYSIHETSTPGVFTLSIKEPIYSTTETEAEASTELIKLLESPITVESKSKFSETVNSKLSKSRALVEKIIADSKARIKFDKDTHTYYVDGKKADTSVTQYIHGNTNLGPWGLPSTTLGTTVDNIARDFFAGKVKKRYPNLRKKDRDLLISDLERFKKSLDEKFGEGNYEVITEEFPIASSYAEVGKDGKTVNKVMAGTMDMLVYDKDGNFYIYDFKTTRSGINKEKQVNYTKQLNLYKAILESNYPALKGNIKELNLIEFSVFYPAPTEVEYISYNEVEGGVEEQLYIVEDDGISDIQDVEGYLAPRYNGVISLKVSKDKLGLQALTTEEKELLEEELGTISETTQKVEENKPINKTTSSQLNWDNTPLLTASEKRFLSNHLMHLTSFIVGHLNSDPAANEHYLGDKFSKYDFTKMDRRKVLEIVGIGNIFNYIKEEFYNPDNRLDIEDFNVLDKLQVAYDNFEAMSRQGYSKLIALEDVTVVQAKPEYIKREDVDTTVSEDMDTGSLEEKEREYWQIGQRQVSARASLSSTIRRIFERMYVVDQNGNPIKDEFGFNMDTFVDANEAINSILEWVNAATTMEEMESILEEMAPSNPWLNNILEAIKEEPIRSQFFQNFRKDFTTYSVIRVEYDNKTGARKYVTDIVNTKGVDKTILSNLADSFKLGAMTNLIIPIKGDLEGRGKVNTKVVEDLKKKVTNIKKDIVTAYSNQTQKKVLKNYSKDLAQVLSTIGLPITPSIVDSVIALDLKKKGFNATKISTILNDLSYLLDTLLTNKSNTEYNPMLKEERKGNIYGNYSNIISVFSPYIKESVESSTYENGKMYYSFTTPSYMGKLINRLSNKLEDTTKFKKFLQDEYGSYKWFKQGDTWNCPWLEKIANSERLRQGLQHKVQLSFDKTDYTELSELSYTLSLMHEYFYDETGNWAWYRLPILANKPSSEFIRFERISGANYKSTIKKGLRKVFDQEIMRIKTVIERSVNPDIEKIGAKGKVWFDIKEVDPTIAKKIKEHKKLTAKDLATFKGSGAEFKFLSPLNQDIISNTPLGKLIIDKINGVKVNEDTLNKLFNSAVDSFMEKQMSLEKANWQRLGLFDTEKKTIKKGENSREVEVFKYVSQFSDNEDTLEKQLETIEGKLEEYVWNDMFATINIIELTATDLAYYKNVEDFQKRYSQVHAPSMRLNTTATFIDDNGQETRYSADGLERTMYLKDAIAISDIIPNVSKIFDDKISSLKSSELKREMEIMKSLIVKAFKDINIADAQGYSSPTSYRKKMGMQGKWSEEMETAYQEIINGNLNINNLGVLWQPFKPFVYSQIRKNSGATTMSELKVPVQNKNSEYLLLIADAIMRSGKLSNKLQAIFDFMEESAYDNGIYNGKGIDTVQFISAVNSGGMGAIDIHNLNSYQEVKETLMEKAYYRSDKQEDSNNEDDRYDERYVHTIPFEDYGMQQEVPAHMADHMQAMGSQVRILSVSDISDGVTVKVKDKLYSREDLHKEYFSLIADNIKESYEQLKRDLNLKGTRLEQNEALSKLLQETILKDQRYGSDLLRACSLDSNGEFVIPLSDPIQSIRIQQLLNSIIKSRINKQEVKGGPAVQVSAFGLSDDLNIVWQDKKGNILKSREEYKGNKPYEEYIKENQHSVAHFEVYAPIPSKDLESALLTSDGSYMTPERAIREGIITEDVLKAIGYRIPTEDKYSIIPMKIKGFVPKAAGEVVIMPKEITTLSGSDFDIDKMYIMFKEFHNSKTDWKKLKEDFKKTITEKGAERKKKLDALDLAIDYLKNGDIILDEDSVEMDVHDFYVENYSKYNAKTKFQVIEETNTTSGRNNRIFDIQWAVLTHQDTMVKMFNPGSFDVQKKSARIINILKSSKKYSYSQLKAMTLEELDSILEQTSNLNIIFPSTQVYFHKQNMTAGKLIGIFANNNTSHAFLSMQDIHFNINPDKAFTFNNVTVGPNQNTKIDALNGKDGSLISKTIAGFLAASVDAVKDPVLNYMNLNSMTAGPAMVLARLGFDSDSIGLLLTQPIIEKLTEEYFKRNNEGYTTVDEVVDEILSSIGYSDDNSISILEKDLVNTTFTKEEMAKSLSKGASNTEFQGRCLLLFQRLSDMSKDLGTLTFLTKFNSVTNAVGPTIADTFVMKERYMKFLDRMESKEPPFNENAINVISNNPMLEAFYETTVGDSGASSTIFGKYFPHYSTAFSTVLNLLRGTTKGNIDSKTINKLANDFVLYKLTMEVLDTSFKNRHRFINTFVTEFSDRSKDISNNDLLKIINVRPRTTKCPVSTLESKTGGYSIDIQERVKDGWSNLLLNEDTRSLGIDLFYYNLIRSGFNFSPKTLGYLASVDVRLSIPGYIDTISDIDFSDDDIIASEFLTQFRRNHYNEPKIVPVLKPSNKFNTSTSKNSITFAFNKRRAGIKSIIVEETIKGITWAPVINYNDKLYILSDSNDNTVTYIETTPLGNPNNFLEYNAEEGGLMASAIGKNSIVSEKSDNNPTPNNPSVKTEEKPTKSINYKEIDRAIYSIFETKEAQDLADKVGEGKAKEKDFISYVVDKASTALGVDWVKPAVEKKLRFILKDMCK